jgi:hypothetical protein
MTRLADLLKSAAALITAPLDRVRRLRLQSEPAGNCRSQLTLRHEGGASVRPARTRSADLDLVPLRVLETIEQLWVITHDADFRKHFIKLADRARRCVRARY